MPAGKVKDGAMQEQVFELTGHSVESHKNIAVDQWFSREFWPAYPRKVGKDDALKWCRTHAKAESARVSISKGLSAWLVEFAGRDTEYVPYPGTWLRKGHWKEESWPGETTRGSGSGGGGSLQQSKTVRAAVLWLQQGGGQ